MSSQLEQQPATTQQQPATTQPQPTTTQQPLVMYPYNVPGQPQPMSRPHSDGSFGGVFIVLAVIVLVSAVACCLGRFCGRRREKPKGASKKQVVANATRPPKEIDIEYGFDHKKIRTANRPVRYGEYKGNNNSKPGLDDEFGFDFKKGSKMMPSNAYDGEPTVGP